MVEDGGRVLLTPASELLSFLSDPGMTPQTEKKLHAASRLAPSRALTTSERTGGGSCGGRHCVSLFFFSSSSLAKASTVTVFSSFSFYLFPPEVSLTDRRL